MPFIQAARRDSARAIVHGKQSASMAPAVWPRSQTTTRNLLPGEVLAGWWGDDEDKVRAAINATDADIERLFNRITRNGGTNPGEVPWDDQERLRARQWRNAWVMWRADAMTRVGDSPQTVHAELMGWDAQLRLAETYWNARLPDSETGTPDPSGPGSTDKPKPDLDENEGKGSSTWMLLGIAALGAAALYFGTRSSGEK